MLLQRSVIPAFFCAALAALVLRLALMGNHALTYDEAATAYFAALPMADLWGAAGRLETNPPLFYALAGIAARLGLAPEELRVVSILPDAATVLAGGLLARRLAGGLAGVLAAWLIALSATVIEVSLEARAYSLLALWGMLGVLCAVRVLLGGGWRWLAALGACEIGALYTHNVAAIMLGGLNGLALIAWLGGWGRGTIRRWLLVQAAVVVAWLYWLPTVLGQAAGDLASFWIARPDLPALRYAVQRVVGLPWLSWPQPAADLLFAALGAAGLVLLAWRPGWRRWLAVGLAVAVLAGVPLVTWAISQWRPLMNGRVLLWLVPLHIVLVAVALARLRLAGVALAAVLAAAQLHALPFWRPVPAAERWPQVAALLRDEMRPGDAILLLPTQGVLMLAHYGWRPGALVFGWADGRWYTSFPGTLVPRPDAPPALPPDARIWVVTRRMTPQHEAAIAALLPGRAETRRMRGGARIDSGLDVSLLAPR